MYLRGKQLLKERVLVKDKRVESGFEDPEQQSSTQSEHKEFVLHFDFRLFLSNAQEFLRTDTYPLLGRILENIELFLKMMRLRGRRRRVDLVVSAPGDEAFFIGGDDPDLDPAFRGADTR